tara:strand:+ start:127 stop:639 length:513 start_codon:yes stop_codon:yes gene_type:complete
MKEHAELKQQIKENLLKSQKEAKENLRKASASLEGITYYSNNTKVCNLFKNSLKDNGVNFTEKDIQTYPEVLSTVQIRSFPIIEVNGTYLVYQRDFTNANMLHQALMHLGSPDYVKASSEITALREQVKNLQHTVTKTFQNISRQLQPITKVMNELAQEEAEENKKNSKS